MSWMDTNGNCIAPSTQARHSHSFPGLLVLSDEELPRVDPLEMNLLIAKGIPSLAHLDIPAYQQVADTWAADVQRRLPAAEVEFRCTPWDWKNDLHFFRLGFLCWYVDEVLGIRYREDQKNLRPAIYTDPSDLFLNGVMDTRRGTCGNMAALHVALGWRLGWPVSLACAGAHLLCRYDDGRVIHNIEATKNGQGGFHSSPDAYYRESHGLSEKAILCGSDLHAVTPREMLGIFVGLRARHLQNTDHFVEAERDYLLARYLFPQCRDLYNGQMLTSVMCSLDLFAWSERGHPFEFARFLCDVVRLLQAGALRSPRQIKEGSDAVPIPAGFTTWVTRQ